jgi:hypothetical protein
MDFLSESNGSDISYLLNVSASLSLSDDDDQVNAIGLGVRDTSNRAGGLGVRDEMSRAGGFGRVHHDGGGGHDKMRIPRLLASIIPGLLAT